MELGSLGFVLLSALALGGYDLCKKHAVKDNAVLTVLLLSTFFGGLAFTLFSVSTGHFSEWWSCTPKQYGLMWVKTALVATSWTSGYYALKKMPISIAAPIRATGPFWVVLGGICLFHEIPSWGDAIGMLFILAGYYGFVIMGQKEGFSLRHSRGMQLIILATISGAASGLYDKYLLNTVQIPPRTLQQHFVLNIIILYLIIWAIFYISEKKQRFQWRWTIVATGLFLLIADFCYFYATSQVGAHISQISLVRRLSTVITFFVGAAIFHDRNMRGKTIALALIVIGVVLLALM